VNISGATTRFYTTPPTTMADNGARFAAVVTNPAGSVTSNNATLTVNPALIPPLITTQPADQTVAVAETAMFSVTATGTGTLRYQWMKNGVNISGATGRSYTTPPTTMADNGARFAVVVSNAAGSVTSNNATLTVNSAIPPSITTQPANKTVRAGQTATFTVTAGGTAPFTYQWTKNGANISGATSRFYTTPPTTAADNGALFAVVVSNAAGSVTSNNATLTVR
jgi:Immunoglobulin domain